MPQMRGDADWKEGGLAASEGILLWASSLLLWLGGVLTGVQRPQHLQALGDLLLGPAGSFFIISHGSCLIPSLTLGFLLFSFQPPGPDYMLGPPEDDGVVPDAG